MNDIDKKREEIREGLGVLFKEMGLGETISMEDFVEQINRFYHSQNVVIKVDRELPKDELAEMVLRQSEVLGMEGAQHPYYKAQLDMFSAGYVAIEPLIKEDR